MKSENSQNSSRRRKSSNPINPQPQESAPCRLLFFLLEFPGMEAIIMNPKIDMETVAEEVGGQGVEKLVCDAERICAYEQRRIALENEPAIVRLQAEGAILVAEERRLACRLALAPPPGDRSRMIPRRIYYWAVVVLLAVTGFFAIQLSFAPFRLGWMSWLISAGMAALTPFLIDRLLEHPRMEPALRILTAVAAVTSLASLMLLALVRGDLLAQQIREDESQAAVIDDAQPQTQTPNSFYDQATDLLCAALLLMAFATEVGGGLVLHAAWRSAPDDSEDWAGLRRELLRVRGRLAGIAFELTALRNAPQVFEARYWRDFYRALLLGATRNAMTRLLFVLIVVIAGAVPRARAQSRLDLVVAIDLTQSVAATGPDGGSDFEKNVEGVSKVLAQVPAGTHLTIVGITDQSFSEPYILMRAQIPNDPGYFGEKLTAARAQIVHAWAQKSAKLRPDFRQTDIFGALELASQIFSRDQSANRRELVVFSDMRESVPFLDFEMAKVVPEYQFVANKCGELSALKNTVVYLVGVDGAEKSAAYWESLHQFWREYFQDTGATLQTFTVLRDSPHEF